ncbi:unnamed protein product [Rotaria socialis]|uniref:Uncharacterized protein n=1 Tax=Rotaria socialis TaxID=392032 RepID=A0A818LTF1_9BILA|nr:unnamed protein product [Rotaria socialis]
MAVRSNTYNPPTITNTFTLKLSIILSISIALLLTIGKSKCDDDASNFNHAEPCDCGCQAISSQITPRIVNVHGHQAQHIWLNVSMHVHESYDDVAVIRLDTAVILDDNVSLLCIVPENRGQQELKKGQSLIRFTISKITICITRTSIMCADFPPTAICFDDSGGPLVQLTAHSNRKTY